MYMFTYGTWLDTGVTEKDSSCPPSAMPATVPHASPNTEYRILKTGNRIPDTEHRILNTENREGHLARHGGDGEGQ